MNSLVQERYKVEDGQTLTVAAPLTSLTVLCSTPFRLKLKNGTFWDSTLSDNPDEHAIFATASQLRRNHTFDFINFREDEAVFIVPENTIVSVAKTPPPTPTMKQRVNTFLEDRFNLRIHWSNLAIIIVWNALVIGSTALVVYTLMSRSTNCP